MININILRLAVFDFDETLAIHKSHAWNKDIENRCIRKAVHEQMPDADLEVNDDVRLFVQQCAKKGIKTGLMSATGFYPLARLKCEWSAKQYEVDMENYCVGTIAEKIPTLCQIAEALDIPRSEVLIVDDLFSVLGDATEAGFQAATPLEVINYVRNME